MKISQNGIKLIKKYEGCSFKAYKPVATEKYYTIGYGHYGPDVSPNMVITQEQADALLVKDLEKFESKVNLYMSIYNFNQNQYDAMVSFALNIGNISGLTINGTRTISQISSKIPAYNKAGGKVLSGLVKRREEEKKLFDTPVSKSKTESTKNSTLSLKVGSTYTLLSNLAVRKSPSATSILVGYDNLTASAKKADKDKNGYLEAGTQVNCKAISKDKNGNTWIKIPSGYIAAIYKGKELIK